MDLHALQSLLSDLPLGQMAYFDVLDSTNEQALRWAQAGAPHLSLVVADEQTAGRGRSGRAWFTPRGAALAFSLILRPEQIGSTSLPRLTGLGALAVCEVLNREYDLQAQINGLTMCLSMEGSSQVCWWKRIGRERISAQ